MHMAALQAAIYNLIQKRGQLHLKSFVSNDKMIQNLPTIEEITLKIKPFFGSGIQLA